MSRSRVPPGTSLPFSARVKRRVKFAAGSIEPSLRKIKLEAQVAGKGPKSRSEKSRSAWRSDPLRDEKIFSYISSLARKGQPVRLSVKSAHSVSLARKNLADANRAGLSIIPDVFVPDWDHSSDLMKMLGWGLAARELEATPFTLRVSDTVMDAAHRSRVGPSRYLQDRLARHLRTRLPSHAPTFWFAVEQGHSEQAHLHGAMVIPEAAHSVVREALASAGGKWEGGSLRQVHFSRAKNPIKWVAYSTKWLFGTHRRLCAGTGALDVEMFTSRSVPIAATQGFRAAARDAYQVGRRSGLVIYP
jgi:hypothetical protein